MLELISEATWKTWGVHLLCTINICLSSANNVRTQENHGGEQGRDGILYCVMCKACRLNGLNFRFENFTLPGDCCSKVPWINSDLPLHEVNTLNITIYILWTILKYMWCVFWCTHVKSIILFLSKTQNQCAVLSPKMPLPQSYFYHDLWFDWYCPFLDLQLFPDECLFFWDPLGW